MGRKVVAMSGPRPTQLQVCGVLRPIGEVTDGLVGELKFHRQVEKLHRLGPRPYGELLVELGEQLKCRTFIDTRQSIAPPAPSARPFQPSARVSSSVAHEKPRTRNPSRAERTAPSVESTPKSRSLSTNALSHTSWS